VRLSTQLGAVSIVEKEMAKAGASMLQLKNVHNLEEALKVMLDASMLSAADSSRLTALVQQNAEDDDAGANAPDPAVYKSHSGDIVATLQNMFEKAEGQLAELRNDETKDMHNFQAMKQGLEDEIKYGQKELSESKANLAAAEEKKAGAEGELAVTTKDLNNDIKVLADLHANCMSKANDYEDESKSRSEELNALAAAKKAIVDNTSGSTSHSYSFIQSSRISSRADLANFEAVQFIRNLAKKHGSAALAQLASRMSSAMSFGARSGEDPFIKVKGLIQEMIEKLEAEAEADASLKAFCDRENAESNEKKQAKESEIEKLSTSIDSMSARSAKLKEEVATLQKELGDVAKAQAEMDKVRAEEKETYGSNKADMEQGIKGVKLALKVLTEYYAKDADHAAAGGAGAGIIGLLEVIESDFTKGLAEDTATEAAAADAYDKQSKENEITTTTKQQDVKYKTKEFTGLDKSISEATSDRASVQEELDAVNEYLAELKTKCFPFPRDTYEERVARRTAEIEGLKDGLKILSGEAVLMQRSVRRSLRKAHAQ
jgi:predicted  nucleic acid-binding Zn-ribbon protein